MVIKLNIRELFLKLSLLSKSSPVIKKVFNGARIILNTQNALLQPLNVFLFLEKKVSLDQKNI